MSSAATWCVDLQKASHVTPACDFSPRVQISPHSPHSPPLHDAQLLYTPTPRSAGSSEGVSGSSTRGWPQAGKGHRKPMLPPPPLPLPLPMPPPPPPPPPLMLPPPPPPPPPPLPPPPLPAPPLPRYKMASSSASCACFRCTGSSGGCTRCSASIKTKPRGTPSAPMSSASPARTRAKCAAPAASRAAGDAWHTEQRMPGRLGFAGGWMYRLPRTPPARASSVDSAWNSSCAQRAQKKWPQGPSSTRSAPGGEKQMGQSSSMARANQKN